MPNIYLDTPDKISQHIKEYGPVFGKIASGGGNVYIPDQKVLEQWLASNSGSSIPYSSYTPTTQTTPQVTPTTTNPTATPTATQTRYSAPTAVAYNYNPAVREGTYDPAYGGVPGPVSLPSPYSDLGMVYPNLSGTNSQISRNISGQLLGQLSPETVASIQDDAARFGVSSGVPGGNLAGRRGLRNLGLAVEDLQNKGIENYNQTIPVISRTQTLDPALQANIAAANANMNAAPIPKDSVERMMEFYKEMAASGAGSGGVPASTFSQGMPQFSSFGSSGSGFGGAGAPLTGGWSGVFGATGTRDTSAENAAAQRDYQSWQNFLGNQYGQSIAPGASDWFGNDWNQWLPSDQSDYLDYLYGGLENVGTGVGGYGWDSWDPVAEDLDQLIRESVMFQAPMYEGQDVFDGAYGGDSYGYDWDYGF